MNFCVIRIQDECDSVLNSSPVRVERVEMVLKKYSRLLHPRHAIIIKTKYNLAGLYGR